MAEAIGIEVVKELVKQLSAVSKKAYMCKSIAKNLATTIADFQPTILEIMDSSGESSEHRQDQLRMFFDNLEECRMLTEKVLRCKRWNLVRQINYVKKMEDLDRKISRFFKGPVHLHVLADVRHLVGAVDRMNKNVHKREQVNVISDKSNDEGRLAVDRMNKNVYRSEQVTMTQTLANVHCLRDTSRVSLDRIFFIVLFTRIWS
ncbi:probable disease resistance protein At5g04720 [Capsella rubella]|uniref:probable disease resistance protein At5g04720 n=1 Tax=Capsella rubella TaxID=81985 RepID=UPI000CD5410D|nr:probable disease resistance protein At5g04720 [Capsella rubella]